MPKPRAPRGLPRPITTKQLSRLLGTRMHHRTRVMILLASLAGLRAHEIAKIRGEDLDVEQGVLHVVGKGGVSWTLPAHPMIVEYAATMPRRGHWFTTHVGPGRGIRPIRRDSVSVIIGDAMTRAGIDGGAHRLRHWYVTTIVDAGADPPPRPVLRRHQPDRCLGEHKAVDGVDVGDEPPC